MSPIRKPLAGILIAVSLALLASADAVGAASSTLEYRIVGDQFQFFNGDSWTITNGETSWQFFDLIFGDGGLHRAVYGVTGFSITAVDLLGTLHTITAIPDGLRSPVFHDPIAPDIVQDVGLVNVYPGGFLDMIVYDLSIDGQTVNPFDTIGGPAFTAAWVGSFPEPTSFSVSMSADLGSRNLHGEISLLGELIPEPSPVILASFAVIGVAIYGARGRGTRLPRAAGTPPSARSARRT